MASGGEPSFAELLSAVADRTPAPGGGSAAAWCGALAAALLEMAASFTGAPEIAERASTLREQLVGAGEQELHSYEPVLAAMRLPADAPLRAEQLEQALAAASGPPLAIAQTAAEVTELAASVASQSTSAISGDALAGVLLAEAAVRAAAELVKVNRRGRAEDPDLLEARRLSDRAAKARAGVLDG